MVAIGYLEAFIVSLLIGYLVVDALVGDTCSGLVVWLLSPALGAAISSLLFFWFRRPLFTVETILIVVLVCVWFSKHRFKKFRSVVGAPTRIASAGLPALIFVTAFGMAVPGLMIRIDRVPHGDWDGWAIWDPHARLLFRDGVHWKEHIANTFHPDYPLLTPAVTARYWRWAENEKPEVGAVIGVTLAVSAIGLLYAQLSELRGSTVSSMFSLMLIGTPAYLLYSTSHYADIPLSCYALICVAMVLRYFHKPDGNVRLLVVAGFSAGCAAWTKNEGLLFLLCSAGALAAPLLNPNCRRRELFRCLMYFGFGAILPLLTVMYFRSAVAPPNELLGDRNLQDIYSKITDLARHATILRTMLYTSVSFGNWWINPLLPLAGIVALTKSTRVWLDRGWLRGCGIVGAVLVGYYALYLITPIELQVHLDTSLDRLFLQLWPSALLLTGLLCRPAGGLSPSP
jgi:hypothetical protein